MKSQIRTSRLLAVVIAGGYSLWAHYLIWQFPDSSTAIIFFASLSAIGCAFALSSDPPAASAPLFLLGLPLAADLILFGSGPRLGMGVSLLLVLLLTYRMVRLQNQNVGDLVSSRLSLEVERNRARDAERSAQKQASTDPLTGIANRRALTRALGDHTSKEAGDIAIASIDLDGFKPINDVFGHDTGDIALACIATRLVEKFGSESLVARMGGDEFAILWMGPGARTNALSALPELTAAISEPLEAGGRTLRIGGCVGVAMGDGSGQEPSALLSQADAALYEAKAKGSGKSAVFSDELSRSHERRLVIETAVRDSTLLSEMEVVYQPIRAAETGDLVACEALARWTSPLLGEVSPSEFIPIAEQMNMISAITERTLELAVCCACDWPAQITLSFNVSAVYLCWEDASQTILSIMARSGLPAARMQLEVTETAVLTEFDVPRQNLAALRSAGARIALDDFGAGNASISYLREMNFDAVKFDGSLIVDIATDARRQRLLGGLVKLCKSLGAASTAEHVASVKDLTMVRSLGCDNVQGYLVGRPCVMNGSVLRKLLTERRAA
ncbi:bifunctional diguanylate cyclase/phosphodiesterase [Erythrobacter sp. SD-21]|uniref:putative bifunctional diguanylate cyclase/phosphodiesterase n=1 Tax=Erythrobacter sp. SD-21 TaxID=161528 RepID=UPI0018DBF250|nr:EAL domain-containing protein [Erythrobacter sp. SD-21]